MQKIVIIIGGPGSGKGTIAELLMRSHKFNYIETGALFRSLLQHSDIARIMACGGLIPDEKIFPLIIEHTDNNNDIIFDGFPRNIIQAKWLLENFNACISVIYLKLSKSIMIERIHKRLNDGSTRNDDSKDDIILRRLNAFENETLPAIEFLRKTSCINFLELDGSKTPDEIAKAAKSHLDLFAQA
jgi:adenylate kinase